MTSSNGFFLLSSFVLDHSPSCRFFFLFSPLHSLFPTPVPTCLSLPFPSHPFPPSTIRLVESSLQVLESLSLPPLPALPHLLLTSSPRRGARFQICPPGPPLPVPALAHIINRIARLSSASANAAPRRASGPLISRQDHLIHAQDRDHSPSTNTLASSGYVDVSSSGAIAQD